VLDALRLVLRDWLWVPDRSSLVLVLRRVAPSLIYYYCGRQPTAVAHSRSLFAFSDNGPDRTAPSLLGSPLSLHTAHCCHCTLLLPCTLTIVNRTRTHTHIHTTVRPPRLQPTPLCTLPVQ
jgi:hypothetical protein